MEQITSPSPYVLHNKRKLRADVGAFETRIYRKIALCVAR